MIMKPVLIVAFLALISNQAFSQTSEEKSVLLEREVLKAEQAWLDASKSFDEGAFQRLLREDYVGVDSDGRVQNKVDLIKAAEGIASGGKRPNPPKRTINAIRVRLYTDVAVVTGGIAEGPAKGSLTRFAHIWVKSSDVWQLSTSQVTRVVLTKP
jgi:ketosteroid isomerase-like protein